MTATLATTDQDRTASCRTQRGDWTLTTKRVVDLSEREIARCRKLTLHRSLMRPEFNEMLRDRDRNGKAILARDNNGIIGGWAMICRDFSGERYLYLYVHKRFRRRGLGRALMLETMKRTRGQIGICPWDRNSSYFFEDCFSLSRRDRFYPYSVYFFDLPEGKYV